VREILAVALKEVRQIRRDPLSLAMFLGVPAMMLLLFGYALNFDVRHARLAVQDLDRSRPARDLADAFIHSGYFDLTAMLPAGADLEAVLRRGDARAVLVIPDGLADDLAAGRPGAVQFLVDGSDSNTASTLLGYAGLIARQTGVELRGERRGERPGERRGPAAGGLRADRGVSAGGGIDYRPRVRFNPELKSTQFLVPGLIGFILMLTAVISTALAVVREKERGTMEHLRITPLRADHLLIGKTLPYLVISLAATAIILVAARALFGVVVRGPYVDLFLATMLYLVGALGSGLLISSVAGNQAMAFQVGAIASMLPAIFLSGFIFPLRTMPAALQVLSHAVPARYYLVVLRGIILKGAGLAPYADQILFLAIYAVVVLGLAWVRLTRGEGTA